MPPSPQKTTYQYQGPSDVPVNDSSPPFEAGDYETGTSGASGMGVEATAMIESGNYFDWNDIVRDALFRQLPGEAIQAGRCRRAHARPQSA
jgi:hypothetical protein